MHFFQQFLLIYRKISQPLSIGGGGGGGYSLITLDVFDV